MIFLLFESFVKSVLIERLFKFINFFFFLFCRPYIIFKSAFGFSGSVNLLKCLIFLEFVFIPKSKEFELNSKLLYEKLLVEINLLFKLDELSNII